MATCRYRSVRSFALRYGTAGGRRRRQSRLLPLPPLTGQRSYLPDLAYILENVRLSIPATKAERGRNPQTQLVNYMVTHRHHLFFMHTSYPRTKSLIIPNINFLPIFPQRPEPSQASKKTVDPPPRNIIRKTGPNHATGRTTSHPIPPFHHQPLSSPLQQKTASFFRKPVKAKLLLACRGGKKTAASLALSRCVCRNGLPYLTFTLPCLALPGRYICLCVRYHVV